MGRNYHMNHRILMWENLETDFSGDPAINIQDTVFGFLDEDSEGSSAGSFSDGSYGDNHQVEDEMEDEEKDNNNNSEDAGDKNFWESQNELLQATLCRTTSLETKIRSITKEAVKEAQRPGNAICVCGRGGFDGCRYCLMKEICGRLQNAGFNCAICKSKWRSSPDIPSGEHTFLDVIDNSTATSQKEVRVIIELNFRAEFEMARGSDEYNQLIKKLPEVFVGKIERLLSLIKILCSAAKKCMKEKKMHLAPWRKHRYMQAKWLKTRERITTTSSKPVSSSSSSTMAGYSGRPARPRASMLTVDLLENYPGLHLTAVEVV
ncbi:OLC1v1021506C1 [Oldenlandia corymbosa var. corymbosa]|uniref:OLC1v1021506C1 n=1 Tax=Oldenlandia corymbosa var. corymbosa TaxID=529605 RepID=A0AAV1BX38_OLDCO|nr:OLC1v1021506C1 [Oldenlandia corymbosa var. corymbosa]